MKRYTILAEDGFPMSYEEGVEKTEIIQDAKGEWVKWDDVQELKQSLTELLDVARSLVEADEDDYYSDYRMVAKDARKVIAKFEGTK